MTLAPPGASIPPASTAAAPRPSPNDPYLSFRYPENRWYLMGTSAVVVASQMQSLVLGWQVYEITRDPLSLGLIGLAEALPFLGLTLFGGWAADRGDRRNLSFAAMAVLFVGALVLVAMNLTAVPASVWPFYAVQALSGMGRAFYRPASLALGTELVPREIYQNAATWRSSVIQASNVIGPAFGGLLYSFGSARLAYGAEALLMALGLFAFTKIQCRPRPAGVGASVGRSLAEGLGFVFSQPLILSAISLDLFAVLFGGAVALLPAFAYEILKVGPKGLGIMRSAPALGSVLISLFLAHHPPSRRAGRTLLASVAAFGACWIAFAVCKSFPLALLLLAATGACDNVSVVLRVTLVQSHTPPEMMGRVQAVNGFFIGSSNELGAFESGVTARLLGIIPSVIFGGTMTLAIVAAMAWRVPALRRLERAGA